jgi:hypothetical protein
MRAFTVLAFALALVAVAVAHNGMEHPKPKPGCKKKPTCATSHLSCVAGTPCCSAAQQCTPAPWVDNVTYLCLDKPPASGYGNYEVCAGAPGLAFVPYANPPCSSAGYICVDAPWAGPQKRCLPAPPADGYNPGERCAGAPGKPYVPYTFCKGNEYVCAEDASLGYGRHCIRKSKKKCSKKANAGEKKYAAKL